MDVSPLLGASNKSEKTETSDEETSPTDKQAPRKKQ